MSDPIPSTRVVLLVDTTKRSLPDDCVDERKQRHEDRVQAFMHYANIEDPSKAIYLPVLDRVLPKGDINNVVADLVGEHGGRPAIIKIYVLSKQSHQEMVRRLTEIVSYTRIPVQHVLIGQLG